MNVKLQLKEKLMKEQCELLKNKYAKGLMRLTKYTDRAAVFSAPADTRLDAFLHMGIDKDTFFQIIAQLINVIRWLNKEKLSISQLELNTDYVFINKKTKELYLLYVPVEDHSCKGSLKSFLEMLVFESSFDINTNTDFKQTLMELVSSKASVNSKSLEQFVTDYCPEAAKTIIKSDNKPRISDSKSEYLRQMEAGKSSKSGEQHATSEHEAKGTDIFYDRGSSNSNDWGTVVLDDGNEGTMVLNDDPGTIVLDEMPDYIYEEPPYPKLVRKQNGAEIEINKSVFKIGKEAGSVDYIISDNPTVSRRHADIITENGRYFVYDNNSMNGTYVNNVVIGPLVNVEIYDGTSLRFSDEEFEFRILNY